MDYKARFYSSYLNHFTQPDSIVPDPLNPQSWNRYSYVLNNPIRYNDPSGHNYCDYSSRNEDEDCQHIRNIRKFNSLIKYVRDEIVNDENYVKEKYTALEAMNLVVEKAANIYGDDWNSFFKATNYIFLGTYSNSTATILVAHGTRGFIQFRSDSGDTGFNLDFYQRGDNQVRHFWATFATAANTHRGVVTSHYANFYHDVVEDWMGNKDTTYSDFTLSLVAVDIGANVNNGSIASPSDLPSVFNEILGGTGYTGMDWQWLFNTPDE